MDIALPAPPAFHAQAGRLNLAVSNAVAQQQSDHLSDLEQLQLWRFWQKPADLAGEPWVVSGKFAAELEKPVTLGPLHCNIEQLMLKSWLKTAGGIL